PTRRLEDFLEVDVANRALAKSIRLNQRPESIIESDERAYIGRAVRIASGQTTPRRYASLRDLANQEIQLAGADSFSPDRVMSASEVRAIPGRADFERSQQLIRQAQTSRSFEGQAGFIITGATIRSAVASSKVQVKIDNAGARSSEPAIVSVGI